MPLRKCNPDVQPDPIADLIARIARKLRLADEDELIELAGVYYVRNDNGVYEPVETLELLYLTSRAIVQAIKNIRLWRTVDAEA